MRQLSFLLLPLAAALAQTFSPGSGAPNEAVRQLFVEAYNRGGFNSKYPTAAADVHRWGSTGFIQEFYGVDGKTKSAALVKSDPNPVLEGGVNGVYQLTGPLYGFYLDTGVATAGYPVMDTAACGQGCFYQIFDKNLALFTVAPDQRYTVKDEYFNRWRAAGGIQTLGPAASAETDIISRLGTTARVQYFAAGAVYQITSGALTGRYLVVRPPIYAAYLQAGQHSGELGLPITDELTVASGRRQNFEKGGIEYGSDGVAVIRWPVIRVSLQAPADPVRMKPGDVVTISAVVIAADSREVTDRPLAFTTSSSRVVAIEQSGLSARLRAVGRGTALVTATAEGQRSVPLTVVVEAPCCQIGEGAPTVSLQQSFEQAAARHGLKVILPNATPVERVGQGYVQILTAADVPSTTYLLAAADRTGRAYLVSGAFLSRYLDLGGPAGVLGYPLQDAAGVRQLFENGALAGHPVRLITSPILEYWTALGMESGRLGLPLGERHEGTSSLGSRAVWQEFAGGTAYVIRTPLGQVRRVMVSTALLPKYLASGGPEGTLGFPVSEESRTGSRLRQEFEGGALEAEGGEVVVLERPRQPAVVTSKGAVFPGERFTVSVSGFPADSQVRVSITGEPDFTFSSRAGSYVWETVLPPGSLGPVRIRAVAGALSAEATVTVRRPQEFRPTLTKLSGDLQSGLPGARLLQPLRVQLRSDDGSPVEAVAVTFATADGATISPTNVRTNAEGIAEAWLRLPLRNGPVLATAEGAGQVVTFSARAAASSLQNYPRMAARQPSEALMAAVASMVRFAQEQKGLPAPNGVADVASLSGFLSKLCHFDDNAQQICDGMLRANWVNLWRLGEFAGAQLDVVSAAASPEGVRDLLARGLPVLVALSTGHFLVATGVSAEGRILIQDPAPEGRKTLDEYGDATVTTALAFVPGGTAGLLFAGEDFFVLSSADDCREAIVFRQAGSERSFRQVFCSGTAAYQLTAGAQVDIFDLALNGRKAQIGLGVYGVRRMPALEVTPLATRMEGAVVNAATQSARLGPGSLAYVAGLGLAPNTEVQIGGRPARIAHAGAFRLAVELPPDLEEGVYQLEVRSQFGTDRVALKLDSAAPEIFRVGDGRPAVLNADQTLNGASNPAARGSVVSLYATGIATRNLREVVVYVRDQRATVVYAGPSGNLVGVVQINVSLPTGMLPGFAPVEIEVLGRRSSAVPIAVR